MQGNPLKNCLEQGGEAINLLGPDFFIVVQMADGFSPIEPDVKRDEGSKDNGFDDADIGLDGDQGSPGFPEEVQFIFTVVEPLAFQEMYLEAVGKNPGLINFTLMGGDYMH